MSLLTPNLEKGNRFNEWMAQESDRRSDALSKHESDIASAFVLAIAEGDPNATPRWTGLVWDHKRARELGYSAGEVGYPRRRVTVAEALGESLDYSTGPGMKDVVRLMCLAMHSSDPMTALAAVQLAERCASKYAEHNADEVDE